MNNVNTKERPPTQEDFNKFYEEFMNYLLNYDSDVLVIGEDHIDRGSIPFHMAAFDLDLLNQKEGIVVYKIELPKTPLDLYRDKDINNLDLSYYESSIQSNPDFDEDFLKEKYLTNVFLLNEASLRNALIEGNDIISTALLKEFGALKTNSFQVIDEIVTLRSEGMAEEITYGIWDNSFKLTQEINYGIVSHVIQFTGALHAELISNSLVHKYNTTSKYIYASDELDEEKGDKVFNINGDIHQLSIREIVSMMDIARNTYIENHPELGVDGPINISREFLLEPEMKEALSDYRDWERKTSGSGYNERAYREELQKIIDHPEYSKLDEETKKLINSMVDELTSQDLEKLEKLSRSVSSTLPSKFNPKDEDRLREIPSDLINLLDTTENKFYRYKDTKREIIKATEEKELIPEDIINTFKNKGFIKN